MPKKASNTPASITPENDRIILQAAHDQRLPLGNERQAFETAVECLAAAKDNEPAKIDLGELEESYGLSDEPPPDSCFWLTTSGENGLADIIDEIEARHLIIKSLCSAMWAMKNKAKVQHDYEQISNLRWLVFEPTLAALQDLNKRLGAHIELAHKSAPENYDRAAA